MNAVLKIDDLKKKYDKKEVLKGINLSIDPGRCLALLGESGCGKSTVAAIITGLLKPDDGTVFLDGIPSVTRNQINRTQISNTVQMVFQNPAGSFDPRKKLFYSVTEPLIPEKRNTEEKRTSAEYVMGRVGLKTNYLEKYPWEISGGECQRAALARAIINNPKLLICDEVTSALDVSVQAQIVQVLKNLQQELRMSMLFISHDIALAAGIADEIAIMKDGIIIENAGTDELLNTPRQEYTKLLLSLYGE